MNKILRRSFFIFLLIISALFGENDPTSMDTAEENTTTLPHAADTEYVQNLITQKDAISKELNENSIWYKIYSNYNTYKDLLTKQDILTNEISSLLNQQQTPSIQKQVEMLSKEKDTVKEKIQLLSNEYKDDPFRKLLMPPGIESAPNVTNPFAILSGLSYEKKLDSDKFEYKGKYQSLENIIMNLEKKRDILNELISISEAEQAASYQEELTQTKLQIQTFLPVLDIFKTTYDVYEKKVEEIKLSLDLNIKKEFGKLLSLGGIVLFFLILIIGLKYLVKRYMSDTERFYTINKALNFTFITILILIVLSAYIENVSYLVTVIGFASAGIAIAMKDWFMSLMGWFVIVIGGAIRVGDRVKFVRDGVQYVGDIVDISMLRMTLHEDITLTTFMFNRRSGRMIFIPNNYIFTDMIANYSHDGLSTVWDGIDFVVSFDSNYKKAAALAKQIAKKYSKGYTDITRKRLNKMRSHYSMKSTNVEPRIFTFIEPYGVKISVWYHTNSFATLTLRSTISSEILSLIEEHDDIFIAYPTQSVYVDKHSPQVMNFEPFDPTDAEHKEGKT